MRLFGQIAVLVFIVAPGGAAAQNTSFEEAATVLRDSCAKDIEEYCYGVNPGSGRLKSCIVRNSDSVAAACRTDYVRAFAMISKRAQARGAVLQLCDADIHKFCAEVQASAGQSFACLMAAPKGISRRCVQALADVATPNNAFVDTVATQETAVEIDLSALRKEAQDRAKKNADRNPVNRPPVSDALDKLPHFTVGIQFKPGTATIAPASYPSLGQLADALLHPRLTDYRFVIIDHTESGGRRDENLMLSQRRSEAIRETLLTVFSISSKRIEALGLGEEQFADRRNPKAATNHRTQFVAVGAVTREVPAARPRAITKPRVPTRRH